LAHESFAKEYKRPSAPASSSCGYEIFINGCLTFWHISMHGIVLDKV